METQENKRLFPFVVATLTALLISFRSLAEDGAGHMTDHGITFYYAIIPAATIRGHEKQHPEATMHGGPPRSQNAYHLTVALFDAATSSRITDADVTAKVAEVGLAAEQKKLEPFTVAGALTYGNYFTIAPRTNYLIDVNVDMPSSSEPAHIRLSFKRQ
ncbi:hypothetical protein [Methylosinus sp. LW3]|uniref:hypothetical protein n=1 Tax=Methylosinus sp. LW3 TaxID=107635 RepID=UPI000464C56B|nr:hypothetical protein [Methylosinus sp. LW3]